VCLKVMEFTEFSVHSQVCVDVLCPNEQCKWKGKTRADYNVHFPKCDFGTVPCPYCVPLCPLSLLCASLFQKFHLAKHKIKCPSRPMKCVNFSSGCRWFGPQSAHSRHQNKECEIRSVKWKCEYYCDGCTFMGSLSKKKKEHALVCRFERVKCMFPSCRWGLRSKDYDDHVRVCPHRQMQCRFGSCLWRGEAREWENHKNSCSFHSVVCSCGWTFVKGRSTEKIVHT